MDSGSNPYNEELILKSYGLLDSSTIEQLGSTLGRECSTKTTKKVPPRLTGIRHSAHNSLEDSLMPMPKGGFHERAIATINASRKPSEKALRNRSHYFQTTSSMKDKSHFPLKIKSTKLNGYTRKKFAELRSKFKTSGPIQTHPMPEIHVIRPNKPHSSLPNVIPESDMSKSPERSITDNETLQTPAVNSRFLFNESSQTNSVPPYIGPNQEKPKRRHQTTKDGDACIFCGLPLYDTLSIEGKEQVIDLSCEHQVHEQCLLLEMELKNMSLQDSTDTSLSSSPIDEAVMRNNSYPKCPKCNNGTIAVPRDSEIKDRLGVQILLYPKTNLLQKLLGKSTGAKVDYSPIQVAGDGISSMVASSVNSLSSNSSPSSNTSFKLDSKLPEEILPVPPDWVLMYDVEDLRKKFITELNTMVEDQDVNSLNEDLILTRSLLDSFGSLRLFDKISFRFENQRNFLQWYCYFFKHMLVFLEPGKALFALVPITPLIRIKAVSDSELSISGGQRNSLSVNLKSDYPGLISKWRNALENNKASFGLDLLTSTVSEDEFKPILEKMKTDEVPTTIPLRNSPKINKNIYEYTFSAINNDDTPDNIVVLINEMDMRTKKSFISIVNIFRCFDILNINTAAIFSSIDLPTWDSMCENVVHFGKKDFEDNAAQLKAKILRMQTNLKAMDSNRKNEDKRTIMNLVESAIDKWKIGKTMLVILSDSALDNFKSAGIQSVLIEINTKEACNDSGSEIVNILNWEDIMEVLCEKCHLDFDNVCLSDDSTKDDELDAN